VELENEAELEVAKLSQRSLPECEQILALEIDLARGRRFEASKYVEQSRFSGTRLTHDCDFLARLDLKLEPAEHAHFAVGVEEALVQRRSSQQQLPAARHRDRSRGACAKGRSAAFIHSE
jgi:hypothetical protein